MAQDDNSKTQPENSTAAVPKPKPENPLPPPYDPDYELIGYLEREQKRPV